MKADIHESTQKRGTFVIVPTGQPLPQAVAPLAPFRLFKQVDLAREQPRVALDIDDALQQLQQKGYAVVAVRVVTKSV
jgi:hypothetical protein